MPIESSVQITGRGAVVIGTVKQGKLKKGDSVEVKGFDSALKSVVTDIQVFKKTVKEVRNRSPFLILVTDLCRRTLWSFV